MFTLKQLTLDCATHKIIMGFIKLFFHSVFRQWGLILGFKHKGMQYMPFFNSIVSPGSLNSLLHSRPFVKVMPMPHPLLGHCHPVTGPGLTKGLHPSKERAIEKEMCSALEKGSRETDPGKLSPAPYTLGTTAISLRAGQVPETSWKHLGIRGPAWPPWLWV